MFRNTYQSGLLSILYSCGSSPLELWDMHVKNGYIRRITDEEVKSLALEIAGTNVATTYIYCPADPKKVLAIRLPFLIMIIKNMKKYFTFEITVNHSRKNPFATTGDISQMAVSTDQRCASCLVIGPAAEILFLQLADDQILDDKNMHRRFRVSNFQSTTRVRPFCTSMPIGLSGGWNQIQFNLADFTRRAYGTNYIETTRMQIHANCRIRRIYFADRLYSEDEMPEEFKLFLPVHRKKCVREKVEVKKPKEAEKFVEEPPVEQPSLDVEDSQKEPTASAVSEEAPIAQPEEEPKAEVPTPDISEEPPEDIETKVAMEDDEEDEDEAVDHSEYEEEAEGAVESEEEEDADLGETDALGAVEDEEPDVEHSEPEEQEGYEAE